MPSSIPQPRKSLSSSSRWLVLILVLGACLWPSNLAAQVVTPQFLAKLKVWESSNGKRMWGDKGRALGPYQFHKQTWDQTTAIRRRQNLPTLPWRQGAPDPKWAAEYAASYCNWLGRVLTIELGYCTQALVYASWNAGIQRVLDVKGNWSKIPRDTVLRAAQLQGEKFVMR